MFRQQDTAKALFGSNFISDRPTTKRTKICANALLPQFFDKRMVCRPGYGLCFQSKIGNPKSKNHLRYLTLNPDSSKRREQAIMKAFCLSVAAAIPLSTNCTNRKGGDHG
jgi:hypothetical protein